MTDLAIEYQTVLGMPPVDFVELAADLDCRHVSMKAVGGDPFGERTWSMVEDADLRSRFAGALADRGVSISLGEGFVVRPGHDLRADVAALDVLADLGAGLVNTVTVDPDLPRSFDQFAEFAALAADRGLGTVTEFAPSLTVADLPTALRAVAHVDRGDFRVLVDTMHAARAGAGPGELGMLEPEWVGYVHLSDHWTSQQHEVYRDDSTNRLVPGEGELPLVDMLAELPPLPVIGVEAPMRSIVAAGTSVADSTRRAVEGARRILADAVLLREVKARGCH